MHRLKPILGVHKLRQLLKDLHLPGTYPSPMTMHRLVDPLVAQPRKNGSQRMKVAMTVRFLRTTNSVSKTFPQPKSTHVQTQSG